MTEVTDIQLHPNGQMARIMVDKVFMLDVAVNELSDDTAINRFVEDINWAKGLLDAARKRHLESNVIAFPNVPKRPLGLAALGDNHAG